MVSVNVLMVFILRLIPVLGKEILSRIESTSNKVADPAAPYQLTTPFFFY